MSAAHEHDWHSAVYVERWIDSDISRDRERRPLLRRAVSLLPFPRDAALRVLDVGGGYGEFTAQILDTLPNSTVTLHDFSEPMVAQAQKRLSGYGNRVTYAMADMVAPGSRAASLGRVPCATAPREPFPARRRYGKAGT